MKRKLGYILALALAVGMLAGCGAKDGKENGSTEPSISEDLLASVDLESFSDVAENKPVEEYVTLGDYKGVEVTVAKIAATEEEIEAAAMEIYLSKVTADNGGIKDRAIELGDTANIDFEGKKDGVAFDGGTSKGYNLGIGSGSFIAGFEEGLVGVKPGETVDLNLTFPENYQSADLAGEAVVFTVTVNYIIPTEMEDAVVAGFGTEDYKNVKELKAYAEETLNAENEAYFQSEAEYAVISAIINNATFTEIPEEMIEKQKEAIKYTLDMYASYYGITAADYCNYFFNMDLESFLALQAEDYAKQILVYQAIANAEGLNVSDRAVEKSLLEAATMYGLSSVEEYLGESTREDYRESLMVDNVYKFVVENAVVKEATE